MHVVGYILKYKIVQYIVIGHSKSMDEIKWINACIINTLIEHSCNNFRLMGSMKNVVGFVILANSQNIFGQC